MKALLIGALVAPLLVAVGASPADAATCITRSPNELASVEIGDTRLHVETVIFDDYNGAVLDSWSANGWNWRTKTYASCGSDSVAFITYRRDADTDNPFRVWDKNWADPKQSKALLGR